MQNKLTAIRLNVSKKIGLGHLRRSQALAAHIGPHFFVIPKEGEQIALQQGVAKKNLLTLTKILEIGGNPFLSLPMWLLI